MDIKRKNTELLQNVFMIIILTASMFDSVCSLKYPALVLVLYLAQGRVTASNFQFEV